MKDKGVKGYGVTPNSLGEGNMKDLDEGYFNAEVPPGQEKVPQDTGFTNPFRGGVVGRPEGWDR